MRIQDDELKRRMKRLKENFRFWSKVNLVLCGGCVVSLVLLANATQVSNSRLLVIFLCTVSCLLPISLVVLLPAGRAAGYIMSHQRLGAYVEMHKSGRLSEDEFKRMIALEVSILEPAQPAGPPPAGGGAERALEEPGGEGPQGSPPEGGDLR